jgi:tetratricopeptide (TPR) repeat protein
MNHPLPDIELIERYFDNTLTEEETHHLKDRLKKDFEFQKLFDREKLIINTVRFEGAKKDLEFLRGIERSMGEERTPYTRKPWYYYAVAASVALIALALWWRPSTQEKPEALYTAYFQPHPNVFEPTLRSQSEQTLRSQAFQAYDQGNYERASSLFSELTKENNDAGVLLLLGNSNLILGKTDVAKQNFRDLISFSDDLDLEAKWYLSLTYLKTGETAQARNLLNEVSGTENMYARKAREVLEKLD